MRCMTVVGLSVCAGLLAPFCGVAQVTKAPPPMLVTIADLTVSARTPAYSLANPCSANAPAITFHLTVQNHGNAASSVITDTHGVWVQDNANPGWSRGAMLGTVGPGGMVNADVTLLGLQDPNAMAGHHVFTVTVNGNRSAPESSYTNNSTTIAVDFPPAFCAPQVTAATGLRAQANPTTTGQSPYAAVHPMQTGLPAPTNLNNTITPGVCANYGGSAAALACSAGLPAGKLVLVWDYPYSNPIDGFRVYATPPASPYTIKQFGAQPVATQTVPGVRLVVLNPPPVGTCFAVTAFHGSQESARSATSFCVQQSNLTKNATFTADTVGAMVLDVYVDPSKSIVDNDYANRNPFLRDLLTLTVGYSHTPSLWRDTAHTQVSQYTNSRFRGYVHFSTGSLNGHQIASARLNLSSTSPGTLCVANWGGADHLWKPGDRLASSGPVNGSHLQGPDAHLDVTSIVQSWANSPTSNLGIALDGEQPFTDIYHLVSISSTCFSQFKTPTLSVTYY